MDELGAALTPHCCRWCRRLSGVTRISQRRGFPRRRRWRSRRSRRARVGRGPKAFYLDEIGHYLYAGETALHRAAATYRKDCVQELIAIGADVRAREIGAVRSPCMPPQLVRRVRTPGIRGRKRPPSTVPHQGERSRAEMQWTEGSIRSAWARVHPLCRRREGSPRRRRRPPPQERERLDADAARRRGTPAAAAAARRRQRRSKEEIVRLLRAVRRDGVASARRPGSPGKSYEAAFRAA